LPIHLFDFDVILGMDWLASHRATIDCYARTVIFSNVRQPEFVYHGSSPLKFVKLISAMKTEFRLDEDDVLWQGTRLCVPNDATMREALLTEAYSSPFSVHPGSTKMYHDLKQHFWWSGMKRDVATFISRCLICQQVKIEHQRASGLLQPLDIPVWKWDEILMDFVTGFPRT
nr:putative reverse transcriptase domain-containing protein [Tanacetum cinerariifolium]